MRYEASEKLGIIRLVEQSALSVRQVPEKIGVPRSTFHRWYDLYRTGGPEALADRPSRPNRTWNRIADDIRAQIVALALEAPDLSPREIAVRFTDERSHFVSEASVYRLLKAHDLITSPKFIVIKAAESFHTKTTAPNQLWQTDFTYLKMIGWGWFYLSTLLDDFSRYIIAWKLCTTMAASDVTDTLELALQTAGLEQVTVRHRPRPLPDNGPCHVAEDLAKWLDQHAMDHVRGAPNLSPGVIARLTAGWQEEYDRWQRRDLSARHYVHIRADGVYLQARMEPVAECMLVVIGATPEGKKELVGFQVGVRESTQSWRELLVDLKARGLGIAPELAVGDGAPGFWKALDEVFPGTRHQRRHLKACRKAPEASATNPTV